MCWNDSLRGWFSEACFKGTCEATNFFKKKIENFKAPASVNGQNPSALVCHTLKLPVIILRDQRDNEQSFCQFSDNSMASANAIERGVE